MQTHISRNKTDQTLLYIYAVFTLCLIACYAIWNTTYSIRVQWQNVPPTPSKVSANMGALGDEQFAYRIFGFSLQNMGNTGGRFTPLKDYNYEALGQWFALQHTLDPNSDFTPMLAAYYFGASQDTEKLRPLIEYLAKAGNSPKGEKWRWLAHSVYLARFKLKDTDLALDLAYQLAAINNPDMPMWARQMPANVLNQRGEKQAAFELIWGILESSADEIHPNEVNALIHYMCVQILDRADAQQTPICEDALRNP